MSRNISISRGEAELLTDLLMLEDSQLAASLSEHIRNTFGMVSQEKEIEARGISLSEIRADLVRRSKHLLSQKHQL